MNHIKRKRSLTLREESEHINQSKRFCSNCIEMKLEKLSSPRIPGNNRISRKRSVPWEENSPDNFCAKRAKYQIIERKFKISTEPKIPNDYLMGLPVLPDSDASDSEEGCPKSEIPAAKSETEDNRKLFSYRQLMFICSELMKRCDDRVVQEYELALTQRMAEQYDTFIKFNHDQLQRECEHKTTYLS
ncbi:uncharacterized protein LOC26526642 [Drosophila erecta]|uniref:Akirin n=1 Tax=Drosophila erecta TaxID=7220 RepID=A0A0Q5VKD6_DROER|nr:uncharacterized protein LOC26526642 [Drosophila erecta]KQS61958.1 uncharacterized protein Dere_GG26818 [Drosophila erecta]